MMHERNVIKLKRELYVQIYEKLSPIYRVSDSCYPDIMHFYLYDPFLTDPIYFVVDDN